MAKAMRVHKSLTNNCAFTSNVWVPNISHGDQARLCDLPAGCLSGCQLAVLAGCHSDESSGSDTLTAYLRNLGVANTIGFVGAVPDLAGAYFVQRFFHHLKVPGASGQPAELVLTTASIRSAAAKAQTETPNKADASDTWGKLMPNGSFVKVNGQAIPLN